MKKTLLSLLLVSALILNTYSQTKPSIKPIGHISISYVPERVFDQKYENEIFKEAKVGLEFNFKKISLESSFIWANYSMLDKKFFYPSHQKYTFDFRIKRDNLSLFFNHYCFHPISEEIKYYNKDGINYILNYTDLTKVGIKYEW